VVEAGGMTRRLIATGLAVLATLGAVSVGGAGPAAAEGGGIAAPRSGRGETTVIGHRGASG
jgi:hypothetical protein